MVGWEYLPFELPSFTELSQVFGTSVVSERVNEDGFSPERPSHSSSQHNFLVTEGGPWKPCSEESKEEHDPGGELHSYLVLVFCNQPRSSDRLWGREVWGGEKDETGLSQFTLNTAIAFSVLCIWCLVSETTVVIIWAFNSCTFSRLFDSFPWNFSLATLTRIFVYFHLFIAAKKENKLVKIFYNI